MVHIQFINQCILSIHQVEMDYALGFSINFMELKYLLIVLLEAMVRLLSLSIPAVSLVLRHLLKSLIFVIAVRNLTEVVPQLLDQLRTVEQKRPASNVSASIQRIRELIAQTRSVASKVTEERSQQSEYGNAEVKLSPYFPGRIQGLELSILYCASRAYSASMAY